MAKVRKELSNDVKEAIVSLNKSGLKHAEIARRLNISRTTISSVIRRCRREVM